LAIALSVGTVLVVARISPLKGANRASLCFIELFHRNIPLLVPMFLWYFILPEILPEVMGIWVKQLPNGQFYTAVICLGFYYGARRAEVLRAGLESLSHSQKDAGLALGPVELTGAARSLSENPFPIFEAFGVPPLLFLRNPAPGSQSLPKGQTAAAQALGLSKWQVMSNVVLPQALRNMLPLILSQTITLFQDTSLVYVLAIPDFLDAAAKIAQRDGRLLKMHLFAASVYFVIFIPASHAVRRLQKRIAILR